MRQCVWHKFIPFEIKINLKNDFTIFFFIWSKKQLKNVALSTREVVEFLELDKKQI